MRLHLDAQDVGAAETSPSGVRGSQAASARSSLTGHDAVSVDKDTVAISATSAGIARLAAEHSAKIARLAEAVQSGAYQVSSDSLSSAIVSRSIR